jgi:beta-galactosidase
MGFKKTYRIIPRTLILSIVVVAMLATSLNAQPKHSFQISGSQFIYDGKTIQIHSGEMHYPRVPHEYWRHRFQMMRAMGLNAVATCVFWNYHETAPGVWDFTTGNHNLAEYIRTAQEEGLFVILRPGPYVCAEWEFGGYPWWLQNNKELVIRNNQPFLDSCKVYIQKLADQVRDLQVTHGGPIMMVQVENEFGSYMLQRPDIPVEQHRKYYLSVMEMLKDAGFDAPMFTSDGSWLFDNGAIPGVLPTANGEDNIDNLKKSVDKYHPGGPYMVAEFYPGWIDHWAEPFTRIKPEQTVNQAEKYLQNKVSFNFYMVHGGTNFGFTAGANYNDEHGIQPDITSYDYDAPISEAGWVTPKYMALRELMKKYADYEIPEVPAQIPVITLSPIKIERTASFFEWKKSIKPIDNENPISFEQLGQCSGYVLYSKRFNQPIKGEMIISGLRDYALVYINGKKIGELNRMLNKYSIVVDIPFNGRLDILVENMGRINYGADIPNNSKGITSPILINGYEITGSWEMYKIPMETVPDLKLSPNNNTIGLPAFYATTFDLKKIGDVFLDMRGWGKGIVFINGHNLGRYWKVGPQQTLYLPGCWLKKKQNEIVIFEQQNDKLPQVLNFSSNPILEELETGN